MQCLKVSRRAAADPPPSAMAGGRTLSPFAGFGVMGYSSLRAGEHNFVTEEFRGLLKCETLSLQLERTFISCFHSSRGADRPDSAGRKPLEEGSATKKKKVAGPKDDSTRGTSTYQDVPRQLDLTNTDPMNRRIIQQIYQSQTL